MIGAGYNDAREESEKGEAVAPLEIIEDTPSEDENTLLLQQAEEEKAELARKVTELEARMRQREEEVHSLVEEQTSRMVLQSKEVEIERQRSQQLEDMLEKERFV